MEYESNIRRQTTYINHSTLYNYVITIFFTLIYKNKRES